MRETLVLRRHMCAESREKSDECEPMSAANAPAHRKGESIMQARRCVLTVAVLLFHAAAFVCEVGARVIEAGDATASWTGKGVIEDLEDGETVFSGSVTGTMFIRHPEGTAHAMIHAAKIECQTVILLSRTKQEEHAALCVMTAHEGKDVAYGELRCAGKKDDCKGEFTFTYGKGAFKGISGKTPFVGGINIEQKQAGRIYGYAHWPKLTYQLP